MINKSETSVLQRCLSISLFMHIYTVFTLKDDIAIFTLVLTLEPKKLGDSKASTKSDSND